MDDYRARPGDEHVEPLFAGLGVADAEQPPEGTGAPRGRAALQWVAALAIAGGLLAWWLG